MQISIVNNVRSKPFPKLKGICQVCGKPTIAKCGRNVSWHWAHVKSKKCDTWWENETEWHRSWKSHWPLECQEIVHFDSTTGEKHIADIKLKDNTVIEIQNSSMSEKEMYSREEFYKTMIWIVNGKNFSTFPKILSKLPNPDLPESKDICIYPPNGISDEFLFHRLSEQDSDCKLVEIFSSRKIQELISDSHIGHRLFYWKRRREIWFRSTKGVYFDFGTNYLFKIEVFNNRSPYCFLPVPKWQFIELFEGKKA